MAHPVQRSVAAVFFGVALIAAGEACAQQACGVPGPDVVIGNVIDIGNTAAVGGYDAFTLGAVLCNNGTVQVNCTSCPSADHPLVAGSFYRYIAGSGAAAGRMEQVGMSWVKDHFVPANASGCCTCQPGGGGLVLRPGCSDTYSSGFQSIQTLLGPRSQVNAFAGSEPGACPTHPSGGNFGRLEVALADLAPTTGGPSATIRYFGEQLVLSPGDATYTDAVHPQPLNSLNNASNIELTMTGGPAEFNAALIGVGATNTQVGTAAIQRWRQIDSSVTETGVTVPPPPSQPNATEGHYIVCSRATELGGAPPMWHYEFAVYNMNSDRCGGSFSVPIADSATVTNIGFHGVLYRGGDGIGGVNYDGTDWAATRSGGRITWSTQPFSANTNANALRWGTTYNFRFDANVAPAAVSSSTAVTVGLWKPPAPPFAADAPVSITAVAQVPSTPTNCAPVDIDSNGHAEPADVSGFVNLWVASVQGGTLAGDFDGNGTVSSADVGAFVNAWFVAVGAGC